MPKIGKYYISRVFISFFFFLCVCVCVCVLDKCPNESEFSVGASVPFQPPVTLSSWSRGLGGGASANCASLYN